MSAADWLVYVMISRVEERKYKLVHLIIIARNKDSTPVWDHHSKTILMLLLDILKNDLVRKLIFDLAPACLT